MRQYWGKETSTLECIFGVSPYFFELSGESCQNIWNILCFVWFILGWVFSTLNLYWDMVNCLWYRWITLLGASIMLHGLWGKKSLQYDAFGIFIYCEPYLIQIIMATRIGCIIAIHDANFKILVSFER